MTRASAAEERTRRFLADAAHQLRTPIAGIATSVDTLLRSRTAERRDRALEHLVTESDRSAKLVRDLLTLARLDEAAGTPPPGTVDIASTVRAESARCGATDPRVAVRVDVDPASTSPVVVADEQALRDALSNVIDNAVRHAHAEVRVQVRVTDGEVCVDVLDDGPGVPEHLRSRVFERFATHGEHGGTGARSAHRTGDRARPRRRADVRAAWLPDDPPAHASPGTCTWQASSAWRAVIGHGLPAMEGAATHGRAAVGRRTPLWERSAGRSTDMIDDRKDAAVKRLKAALLVMMMLAVLALPAAPAGAADSYVCTYLGNPSTSSWKYGKIRKLGSPKQHILWSFTVGTGCTISFPSNGSIDVSVRFRASTSPRTCWRRRATRSAGRRGTRPRPG